MNAPTDADLLRDELSHVSGLIGVMRDVAADLYAMRGEDELTADRCRLLMSLAESA